MKFEVQLPEKLSEEVITTIQHEIHYWKEEISSFERYQAFILYSVINFNLRDTEKFFVSVKIGDMLFHDLTANFDALLYFIPDWLEKIKNHASFEWETLVNYEYDLWFNFNWLDIGYHIEVWKDKHEPKRLAEEIITIEQLSYELEQIKLLCDSYIRLNIK